MRKRYPVFLLILLCMMASPAWTKPGAKIMINALSLEKLYEIKLLGFDQPEDRISHLSGKMLQKVEEVDQVWNEEKEAWQDHRSRSYIYNEEKLLVKTAVYDFKGRKKLQSGVDIYEYDDNSNNIQIIKKRDLMPDDEIRMLNHTRILLSHNYSGAVIEELFQEWQGRDWQNKIRFRIDYSKTGDLTRITSHVWDVNTWKLKEIRNFTYNDAGRLIKEIIEEYFLKQVFSTHYIKHEYDEEGKLIKSTRQTGVIGNWKPNQYINYSYDLRGKMTQRLIRKYRKNSWKNSHVFLYVYDRQKNLKTSYEKVWMDPDGWKEKIRTRHSYKRI